MRRHKIKQVQPEEFIRDPYVLEFLNLKEYPGLREQVLETAIIDNLKSFLLDIGKGFSFVARQKRMRFEDTDFFVDLVFYNYILKCFVLIDLKIGALTHQDIGQMDSYVRMYEDKFKITGDNPTVELILCSEKNESIAKYSVLNESRQLFASKYMTYLPTEEELEKELRRERNILEGRKVNEK
ncbi:MAG: PDDEXK nuclease domain-containing protein [Methanolobus sp.]|nr:PDDEXK nuclease domain-containing protein [Methanolobus sp.]